MSLDRETIRELEQLLEVLCEGHLTAASADRLERIVLGDAEAMRFYIAYLDLHGNLYWDAASGVGEDARLATARISAEFGARAERADVPMSEHATVPMVASLPASSGVVEARRRRRFGPVVVTMAAMVLVAAALFSHWALNRDDAGDPIAANPGAQEPGRPTGTPTDASRQDGTIAKEGSRRKTPAQPEMPLVKSFGKKKPASITSGQPKGRQPPERTGEDDLPIAGSSAEEIVRFVDAQIDAGLEVAGVESSPRADDAEWIRRVYLDIVGHIPPADVVERFLANEDSQKRQQIVDELLDDPDYVRHFTTIWTNLLVGRSQTRGIDRAALTRFLRDRFARNRPWSETVHALVSAEGDVRENGAANFLVAHLNNEAVPATAITARLFLGRQVQCTQCHGHPFNDWKQNEFWEFNSFFQQTDVVRRRTTDPKTGDRLTVTELVSRQEGGPTFFETRSGLMRVAYPKFEGTEIDPDAETNRRRALADLMVDGDRPLIADAMVNRMWAHFFGYGFTQPIDDMGPHNPATHPALLQRLSAEFVKSGHDVKQLIRWICRSNAYQLTSRFGDTNEADDPEAGLPPMFSRMYVKPMSAEQLYDSLVIATQPQRSASGDWDVSDRRLQWLQQFVVAFQNEENNESTTFDGTIPQALMMMNGELIDGALDPAPGTRFHEVVATDDSDVQKIRQLCLSALSRYPTHAELDAVRALLRERITSRTSRPANRRDAMIEGLQDLFWALLNSNEFIQIH